MQPGAAETPGPANGRLVSATLSPPAGHQAPPSQNCDKHKSPQTPPNVLWRQNRPLPLLRTMDPGHTVGSASGEAEARGDNVTWRNPTPDARRQPPPAARPCLLRRPLQVQPDVTGTGSVFSHFLRPRTGLIFTRVNIRNHGSSTVGSLTPEGSHLSLLGLCPSRSHFSPSATASAPPTPIRQDPHSPWDPEAKPSS